MNGDQPATAWVVQVIACPECDASIAFSRDATPKIDSCGFECYSLECKECKAKLAGIIDPNEAELLLSKLEN